MNSRNHHMFSSVSHFILSTVGGLSKRGSHYYARPGELRREVRWAETTLDGATLFWEVKGHSHSSLHFEINIPAGYTAEVHFPLAEHSVDRRMGFWRNMDFKRRIEEFRQFELYLGVDTKLKKSPSCRRSSWIRKVSV